MGVDASLCSVYSLHHQAVRSGHGVFQVVLAVVGSPSASSTRRGGRAVLQRANLSDLFVLVDSTSGAADDQYHLCGRGHGDQYILTNNVRCDVN